MTKNPTFNAREAQPGAWRGLPDTPEAEVTARNWDDAGDRHFYIVGSTWYCRLTSKGFAIVKDATIIEQLNAALGE